MRKVKSFLKNIVSCRPKTADSETNWKSTSCPMFIAITNIHLQTGFFHVRFNYIYRLGTCYRGFFKTIMKLTSSCLPRIQSVVVWEKKITIFNLFCSSSNHCLASRPDVTLPSPRGLPWQEGMSDIRNLEPKSPFENAAWLWGSCR